MLVPGISKPSVFLSKNQKISNCFFFFSFFLYSNNSSFFLALKIRRREGEHTKTGGKKMVKFLFVPNKGPPWKCVLALEKKAISNGVRVEEEREITLKTSTPSNNEIKGAAR